MFIKIGYFWQRKWIFNKPFGIPNWSFGENPSVICFKTIGFPHLTISTCSQTWRRKSSSKCGLYQLNTNVEEKLNLVTVSRAGVTPKCYTKNVSHKYFCFSQKIGQKHRCHNKFDQKMLGISFVSLFIELTVESLLALYHL